jgi:hypothetical protein
MNHSIIQRNLIKLSKNDFYIIYISIIHIKHIEKFLYFRIHINDP